MPAGSTNPMPSVPPAQPTPTPTGGHPQAHPAVAKATKAKMKKTLPSLVYEVGAAFTAGWLVYIGTNDWKQGVGAGLLSLFGGGVRRAGAWYAEK